MESTPFYLSSGRLANKTATSVVSGTARTKPAEEITDYLYNRVGNLKSVTDPDSELSFLYDGAGRVAAARDDDRVLERRLRHVIVIRLEPLRVEDGFALLLR